MKNTKTFILLLLLVTLFSVVSVHATLVSPASSAYLSGNVSIVATNSSLGNMTNCTFYVKSASTINTTWTQIAFITNTTFNPANLTGSYNTALLEDATDWIFNATCVNRSTNNFTSYANTGITIDNTVPAIPSSLVPATNAVLTTSNSSYTFRATVGNPTTTSCTYIIARGGATSGNDYTTGTGTYSASTCSFAWSFTNTSMNGLWFWQIVASDGTNTTSSGNNIFNVQLASAGGNVQVAQDNLNQANQVLSDYQEGQNEATNPIIWIILIIVVIFVVYWIYKK